MMPIPATPADIPDIVALANLAYRGTGSPDRSRAWTSEFGYIEGLRLTETQLRDDLARNPDARLLLLRESGDGPLLGTVWLEPKSAAVWYLGLLTIDPAQQNRRLGRALLGAAESHAVAHGAERVRITVVNVRESLIAWYERRGYVRTGEAEPFPYGDDRFGRPLRDDLSFLVLEKQVRPARAAGVHTPS